jgi:hypothetical protein
MAIKVQALEQVTKLVGLVSWQNSYNKVVSDSAA